MIVHKFEVFSLRFGNDRSVFCYATDRDAQLGAPDRPNVRPSHAQTNSIFKRSPLDAVSRARCDSPLEFADRVPWAIRLSACERHRAHALREGCSDPGGPNRILYRRKRGPSARLSMCAESTAFGCAGWAATLNLKKFSTFVYAAHTGITPSRTMGICVSSMEYREANAKWRRGTQGNLKRRILCRGYQPILVKG